MKGRGKGEMRGERWHMMLQWGEGIEGEREGREERIEAAHDAAGETREKRRREGKNLGRKQPVSAREPCLSLIYCTSDRAPLQPRGECTSSPPPCSRATGDAPPPPNLPLQPPTGPKPASHSLPQQVACHAPVTQPPHHTLPQQPGHDGQEHHEGEGGQHGLQQLRDDGRRHDVLDDGPAGQIAQVDDALMREGRGGDNGCRHDALHNGPAGQIAQVDDALMRECIGGRMRVGAAVPRRGGGEGGRQ